MGNAPDELSVEFGIKLTAGLKMAVVSGAEASFTVTATWNTSRAPGQPDTAADGQLPIAADAPGESLT